MKTYITIALSLVAACASRAAPEIPEDAVTRYFALANDIQAVVGQAESEIEAKRALVSLVARCCYGELHARLIGWIGGIDLRGSGLSDDIQSMRPIEGPNCGDPMFLNENSVSVVCQYATSESYSLARNLRDISDLYARYPISNISVDELTMLAARQAVPELIEYEVISRRSVDLRVQSVEGQWRVSGAVVSLRDANVGVRPVN